MPIVIMPNGEMVDSTTGNPVNTPANRVPGMENNMSQLVANREKTGSTLTVMEKMQMLMDMGLTEGEAIDAIAMEEGAGQIDPNAFSGMNRDEALKRATTAGMGALGGVPMGGQEPMPMPMPRPTMEESMGADRTMNPMDRINTRNAPST